MQRRHIIAGGTALALLLVVGAVVILNLGSGTAATPEKQPALATLTAQPADTQITLTWPSMEGASGYFVYRDRSEVPLNAAPIFATKYEDIGLTNGKAYTYTVAPAGEGMKAGKHSAEVTVSPKSD